MFEVTKFNFKTIKNEGNVGVFEITPLIKGFGYSLGSALRRTLYSTAHGAAVTKVTIDGVSHQFTTIEGATDDVMHLLLKIKQIRIKKEITGPIELKLEATGPGDVTASQIEKSAGIEIVNKDLVLTNLATKSNKIKLTLYIEDGFGYKEADEEQSTTRGVILLDANFSPIVNVSMSVEGARVGRDPNFDKLTLTIKTDGTIDPEVALRGAAKVLKEFFYKVETGKDYTPAEDESMETSDDDIPMQPSLSIDEIALEELHLPTRTINALRKAGIKTLGDLVDKKEDELLKIRNLGEKSIREIYALLEKENLK